jgi:hypothetical protein
MCPWHHQVLLLLLLLLVLVPLQLLLLLLVLRGNRQLSTAAEGACPTKCCCPACRC